MNARWIVGVLTLGGLSAGCTVNGIRRLNEQCLNDRECATAPDGAIVLRCLYTPDGTLRCIPPPVGGLPPRVDAAVDTPPPDASSPDDVQPGG